jgi:dTDP-4-dehydrorhamnose 3,5-epimerase
MYKRTNFEGLVVLEPTVYEDDRGFFFETYRDYVLNNVLGEEVKFVQENQSLSYKNVFRGLHFQYGEFAQAKLVRVVRGSVLDIALDLRRDQPTYGKYHMELLSDTNRKQMYIPVGFAHGFLTLSDEAIFQYKCSAYYNKESEGGIDPVPYLKDLRHDAVKPNQQYIINERDKKFPDIFDFYQVYGGAENIKW